MISVNVKAGANVAPTADGRPSVVSKQNFCSHSLHKDDMCVLLENVNRLHQEVSNESSQLKLQCSELVTVNQELLDKNQHLQKERDHLLNENEILKEELTRLKLRLSNRELHDSDNHDITCQLPLEEQSDLNVQIRPHQRKSLDDEQENKEKSLLPKPCHELLISCTETHDVQALETPCVSAVQQFLLPDTNDSSETHPKLKCKKTIIQRPNIVIPETVPMDCIEEESDFSNPVGFYARDPQNSQHLSDVQESEMGNQPLEPELVSEETLKPFSDGNIGMHTPVEPVMSDEPGSPVFDRFREVKSVQKQSLESPTLFDEEDDCSVRMSGGSCGDTPVRGSVVIQKPKMKRLNASFKKEIRHGDSKRINFSYTDSMKCSSPSVISGGVKASCPKDRPVSGGETKSSIYFQHCQNDEAKDLVSPVKTVASSDINDSVHLLQQKQDISDNHLIPAVHQRRLSHLSLKQADKNDAKENQTISDVMLPKSTGVPSFCKNRRKWQRTLDPDETFCALGTSVLEGSACESTHYVAPGENTLENSTHFIPPVYSMLENCSPAICNLDSLATVYVNSRNSPDVQLTFSELEREIVTSAPGTDLHKAACNKTLLRDDNRQQHSRDTFKIPLTAKRAFSIDLCSPKLQLNVELAENFNRIPVCDESSSGQMNLDSPVLPLIESSAGSQAFQCPPDWRSSFSMPAHESLQLDELQDFSPIQKPLVDEAMRDSLANFKLSDLDNSFDRVPKTDQLGYAYADVVRKQHLRRQLDSFACVQCEQWYRGLDLTDEQIKERLKTCRHKARFQPTSTPEHYWSVGFPDTQQCRERGYLNVEPISPSKHRRKKGLRVLFESNKERLKERKRKQQSLEQCLKFSNHSPSLGKQV